MYALNIKNADKIMRQTYIFDLDGTLVDSMPVGVGIVLGFLEKKGIDYPSDIVATLTPLGYRGSAEYIAQYIAGGYDVEKIYEYFQSQTLKAYGESIPLKENVKETLIALKSQGCGLNVLTASPKLLTELCLKRLEVFNLFDSVWSIEDFGMTKAQEGIYSEAARRLGVPINECIMADDNLNVLKTAKQAGMRTIGVYDDSSKDLQQEMEEIADLYVRDFKEIL